MSGFAGKAAASTRDATRRNDVGWPGCSRSKRSPLAEMLAFASGFGTVKLRLGLLFGGKVLAPFYRA
jgi:hypothetical protein